MTAIAEDEFTGYDAQSSFAGGENSVADKALIQPDQFRRGKNLLLKRGSGLMVRGGYKVVQNATGQGRWIAEFDMTTGQTLSYTDANTAWYEDTMSPRYRVMNATPGVNDAWYFGGTLEKFFQLLAKFLFAYSVGGNVFVWEVSGGGNTWVNVTADIVESIVNAKQLRVANEVLFSWPDFPFWQPQQVETRNFGYWFRVRCTTGGTNGGSDIVIGQKQLSGDWAGQRKLLMASLTVLEEIPGFTLTKRTVETYQRIDRMDGVMMNDHLYYHSDGQRPLRRWNLCRGSRRDGTSNSPVNAGLTRPTANVSLTSATVAAGYPDNAVLRYCVAYVEGPEGRLGEGMPSDVTAAAAQITLPGTGGPHRVDINFTAIRDSALAANVAQLRVYASRNLVGVDASERADLNRYTLIKVITRDDATWQSGTLQDNNLPRLTSGVAKPVLYDATPTIKPKFIDAGGEHVWIADNHFVYPSDVRRGDSYDPELGFEFPMVRGIKWWVDRLLVFGPERVWAIRDINTGLPWVEDFWLGIGLSQPDSLTVGDDALFFVSHRGPAYIGKQGKGLLAIGRAFESTNYWQKRVGRGRIAQGAYFDDRWYIPIDRGDAGPATSGVTGVYDAIENGWTYHEHNGAGVVPAGWGALGVVHGTLDHELSGQKLLLGFPDGRVPGDVAKLCVLEYGTTDAWTAEEHDGMEVEFDFESRAITMQALHRTKSYEQIHSRLKFPANDQVNNHIHFALQRDVGASDSVDIEIQSNNNGEFYVDAKLEPSANAQLGGAFEDNAATLRIWGPTDRGAEILSWWAKGQVQAFAVDRQV